MNNKTIIKNNELILAKCLNELIEKHNLLAEGFLRLKSKVEGNKNADYYQFKNSAFEMKKLIELEGE